MLHPSQLIQEIEGVGDLLSSVLNLAGFRTVQELRAFDCDDHKIQSALNLKRQERALAEMPPLPSSYYSRLTTMTINVIIRLRGAQDCDEPIPYQFRCPLTLDWFIDPVTAPNGVSYEKASIEEWLVNNPGRDPFRATENLTMQMMREAPALRDATRLFMRHHRKFTIMC